MVEEPEQELQPRPRLSLLLLRGLWGDLDSVEPPLRLQPPLEASEAVERLVVWELQLP